MSTPQLTPELLAESAPRAARAVALDRLAMLRAAWGRLGAGDAEALHDVRVALRRLRSWIKTYRPVLDDTVTRRSRRMLSKLARATNDARDAEVAVAWLEGQKEIPPPAVRGYRDVSDRLASERVERGRAVQEYLAARLPRVMDRLERQLSFSWVRMPVSGEPDEPRMARLTAKLLRSCAKAFARAMKQARAMHDVSSAHQARIAGKALRYLLEPLDEDERARGVIARLSALQDRLGTFHDAQLLAERLLREVEEIAGADARRRAVAAAAPDLFPDLPRTHPSRRGQRAGLIEVARRAHYDAAQAFRAYRREWSGKALTAAMKDVQAIADGLVAADGGARES